MEPWRNVPGGVIDAHHHLWDRGRHPQPWIDPVRMAAIDADFGPGDLAAQAGPSGVRGTVAVQTIHSEAETVDLLSTAARSDLIKGVVGWVDLTAPDVADRIGRLRTGPGGDRLVGVRHLVQSEPDPAFLERADIRRGIAAVADAGLAFDLVIRHHQLPAATDLAAGLPQARFVLDHLGKPPLAGQDLRGWAGHLRALAALPNVSAKVSGLVTEANWSSWQPADLAVAVSHALETFGPDRLMFGSDWPVCLLAAGYHDWVRTLHELLTGCHQEQQDLIWGQTALRVYRLIL
ncbi:amidohydrolase family protein [Jidongwangia harbinensis]|uniref:amidohydrolase family protein n=1 Tax=Jidongwangia harbinensis TaxID=2878561 RepID=UPI001CD9EA24|nr:amidohydrolase family protein [Jidongwangia harbinensis]MCA2215502.1 amidohydrolase family protein [Jidongwangia harbinensis]